MGIGPVVAIPKALALAGLTLDHIGVIELNEAFAAQALAVIRAAEARCGARESERRRGRAGSSAGMHGGETDGDDSARDGAARCALRDGDDVRRRRAGRGGDLRAGVRDQSGCETRLARNVSKYRNGAIRSDNLKPEPDERSAVNSRHATDREKSSRGRRHIHTPGGPLPELSRIEARGCAAGLGICGCQSGRPRG